MPQLTRRELLATSLGGTVVAMAARATSSAKAGGVNEQIQIAVIGVGGMGYGHVGRLEQRSDVRIAAVCDVDEKYLARAQESVKRTSGKAPTLFRDFRRVLDDNAIDAIIVATPHHWHCPIAIRALQAEKTFISRNPAVMSFTKEGCWLTPLKSTTESSNTGRKCGRVT